jgi:PPOX class probable F420-dependent enzyme
VLIYSQPNTLKVRNIQRSARVALSFDGDKRGGDIIVMTGDARLAPNEPPAHRVPAYVAKYRDRIERNSWTPESFAQDYSVAIRVTPAKLRGF